MPGVTCSFSVLNTRLPGLVVVVLDDWDVEQSQVRQDSRPYADFFPLLWLEPSSVAQAYELARQAPALSEQLESPVVLRVTNLLGGSPADQLLHRRHEEGIVLAGTSAGAAMMASTMIVHGADVEFDRSQVGGAAARSGNIAGPNHPIAAIANFSIP